MQVENNNSSASSAVSTSASKSAVAQRLLRSGIDPTIDQRLIDLTHESTADEAAEDRRFRRLAAQVDRESSTLIGLFITLAERRSRCLVTLSNGWDWAGLVTGVGHDFVVVLADDGRRAVLRLSGVSTIQPGGDSETTGEDEPPIDNNFESLLSEFAGYGEEINLLVNRPEASTAVLTGISKWQGTDVACMYGAQGVGTYTYIPLRSILGLVTA